MNDFTPIVFPSPSAGTRDILTEILRSGARRLLEQAVEAEVDAYIQAHAHELNELGHRLVVRNGHAEERFIQTGIGPVAVRKPRVDDQRVDDQGQRIRFESTILPRYLRRTKSLDELIPWLYLKGISTGDFAEALGALLGKDAPNLSANTIMRLKEVWRREWNAWSARSLVGKEYAYIWADGVHFNIRLEDAQSNRQCILVLMGATPEGKKELIAIADGFRESTESWSDLLRDLKSRGLETSPKLAVGDGALGFWAALRSVFPECREQRCWVHKEANVLDKLPKSQQPTAKKKLQDIWMAATRKEAQEAFDQFLSDYSAKYPKVCANLEKDRDELLTFYDFPAEHWIHLRTTNPIESTFATVRLRTAKTKGSGTRQACLTMVFKLCQSAEKYWRMLNGSRLLSNVMEGTIFIDGQQKAAA